MKSQLDERYKIKIDAEHPVVVWLCSHAAYLLNCLEVGKDGRTAYERVKGKKACVLGLEFAERVMWKKRKQVGGHLAKLESSWSFGVFLGVRRVRGEW